MSTITAMIIICCLIISAALTVVIILVTIPTDIIRYELYYPEIWDNRENFYQDAPFHLNETVSYNLRNDILQNSPMISAADILATSTIQTPDTAKTTATTTAIITTSITDNITEISLSSLKSDKLHYQSLIFHDTTIPIKIRKSNSNESSGKSTTINLSANIIITNNKKVTLSNRQSMTKIISNESNSVTKSVTPRILRKNLATLKLHQHIEQLSLIDNDFMNNKRENEQTMRMELSHEMTFPNNVKVVGLAMQRKLLYIATNDGQITVIDPETNKQVNTININGKINRMTITQNGDIIVLNGSNLISYRNAEKYREINLPVVGKSLSAFKNEIGLEQIIALGRSNDVLFVFTDNLKPIDEIYYKNDAKETCNFAILYQKYYYISCQSAILQLSKDGEIKKMIGINSGTFSLGLTVDDQARIIAIVRGQPLLRVFQDGKLRYNLSALSTEEISAIWSEVLYENGRLHVVDYLTSKLKTFRYPIGSNENDA